MTTTPDDGAPSTDDTTTTTTDTTPGAAPDDLSASPPAVGDLVSFTQDTPWGSQTMIGRVLAVGIPDGGTETLAVLEWISPTGPIDTAVLDSYTAAL